MRRYISLFLCLVLTLTVLAGCQKNDPPSGTSGSGSQPKTDQSQPGPGSSTGAGTNPVEPVNPAGPSTPEPAVSTETVKVMVLSGPTGVGAAKLMADDAAQDRPAYQFEVVADNSQVTTALLNPADPVDIACVATNVGANLYNKSNGAIQVLAVNTLGVLYILEKGNSVHALSDLQGKTIYATGQGANPEFILNRLLTRSNLDPQTDVDIQWMTPQEVTAKLTGEGSENAVGMLPVPAATTVLIKDQNVRQALDLSAEWEELEPTPLVMGCVVARTEFIQNHPDQVADFLAKYEQSILYMKDPANADQAAALVEQYGITPSAAVARAALPQCNLTFLSGTAMRSALQDYYEVLFQADPSSIGGTNPDDAFYYIP